MNRIFVFMLCLALLSGCNRTKPDDVSPAGKLPTSDINAKTYVYECADNFSFVARTEAGRAWLFLPGNTLELPQMRSASGTSYTDGSDSFRIRNDEATLKSGPVSHSGCRNDRARAIWEHAKLNGVDFRALGNEPGWYIEISNGNDILLVTDYGQQTYRFTSAIINSKAQNKTTTYHAHNDGNSVEIVIIGTPCQDSMSGEAFPAAVSVLVNNSRYSGCGKALH